MKLSTLATTLGSTAILFTVPAISQQAHAFQLSGWTYSIDARGDGSGGNAFDIRGIAMTTRGNDVLVALTGGMGINGTSYASAADRNIGWGDLFFNFTGKNFSQAQGSLFGIRFAGTNDTNVATGVYSNVRTTSVTGQNAGYSSLNHYYTASNGTFNKANTQGSGITTRDAAYNYYGQNTAIQTSISSGNRLGDVFTMSAAELTAAGLGFGNNAGSQTFGFRFDRSLLPDGNFMANVFLECGNDGVAIAGNSAAVPEPTTMAGAALGIAAIGGLKRMRRQKEQSAS
jgi:hypothetical protein